MSESDDTDLLLLIPPDFFVIQSDSEDSLQSSRGNNSEYSRFKELISQVNELEERVNYIESKDSIISENFAETNRVNRPVDYSLSFDSSKYQNVLGSDLALRFYSLTSAGFSLGSSNNNTALQYLEPCIASASTDKIIHYPHQTSSPVSHSKYESSENCVPFMSSLPKQAISLVSSNDCPVSRSNILDMDCTSNQNAIKCLSSEEFHLPYKTLAPSQPYDTSFLTEIDEFLENKSKQFGKPLLYSNFSDLERQRSISISKSRTAVSNETTDCNGELQSVSKVPSTDVSFRDNSIVHLDEVDKLTHPESTCTKTQFDSHYSHANLNPSSCVAESDHHIDVKECWPKYDDHQSEGEKNFANKKTDGDYFCHVQEEDTRNLGERALYHPTCSKFTLTNKMCSESRQSDFVSDSLWDMDSNVKKFTSSYDEPERNSYVHLNKNTEKHLDNGQTDPLQSENVTVKSLNKDSHSMTYENTYHRLHTDSKHTTKSFPSSKNTNSQTCTSKMPGSRNFVHFGNHMSRSKEEEMLLAPDKHCSGNNELRSNLEVNKDERSSHQNSKFRTGVNSSLGTTVFNSVRNDESPVTRKYHHLGKDDTQIFTNKDFKHLLKECHDLQSEILTSNHKSIGLVSENIINQADEKRQTFLRSEDGANKIPRPTFIDDGYYSSAGGGSSVTNLLSLSDLWGGEAKELLRKETTTVDQKLMEEECRRKHCENVIQKLYCTVLEQQQKLAVAMRVDKSKDHTIQQLQTAWQHLTNHWQELEEQRHSVSMQHSEEREKHQQDMAEIMLKVKWCESELSKALDLAQGYKEKCEMIEQKLIELKISYVEEKKALEISIQKEQKCFMEAKEELVTIQNEISEIRGKLEIAEKNACNEKESTMKAQEEIRKVKTLLDNLEIDFTVVKEENVSLRLRLKEERSRNEILDLQGKNLRITLDEIQKKEKSLQEQLTEKTKILDKTKTDLRDYYQQQVELVVQEKLVEFQTQLDAAELSLHKEMELKEKSTLESASKQIKHITEKNLLEVKLLEEKHQEELHLCKLQITQASQQIHKLQAQLQSYNNRKVEIVEKLHTVMETQWQEALRIISGSSPVVHTFQERSLPENDACNIPDRDVKAPTNIINISTVPPLLVPHSSESSSTTDEIPFHKEDQLTFRANNETGSSVGVITQEDSSDIVKKYIEMLLNRPVGNPLEQDSACEIKTTMETAISERKIIPKWEKVMENHNTLQNTGKSNFSLYSFEDGKCSQVCPKDSKLSKPPWK